MDSRLLLRAAAAAPRPFCHQTTLAGRLSRPALAALPSSTQAMQQRRTKATANRTKRALNIPPHPSFLGTSNDAGEDVVIFNPPSSEASVYHTPFTFLPKSDPRRRANMAALFESSATIKFPEGAQEAADGTTASTAASGVQPKHLPTVNLGTKKSKLTTEEVAEMRRLRAENPIENSVHRLAVKFNCTKLFVMIATGSKEMTDHKKRMERQLEKLRARWGPRKAKARADRYKRTEMLYRGELQ
ncbi:hypothetical protein MCOR25_006182 [Pyricularia grisea]|uniref:Uncharacterized protein n=1 Tax=Pyricularia grisea TaxID=148305 RepID=A0A6P8BM77_PYRGI|nr:uncharacterized protein PgNI_01522 [Pyricularia grisea]KAI6362547.1 hypothetical protein MCOR25_006182 [Pyricularia grisea]TLD17745.1 hypothetical protein PgNI_01522 [Pyricularia grisea]